MGNCTSVKFWKCTIACLFIPLESPLHLAVVLEERKSHREWHCRQRNTDERRAWLIPCFLRRVFSKVVQPSMKAVVEVYGGDFFRAVECANKIVRQIEEWCFFFNRLACNRQKEIRFLMPYYGDGNGWHRHCFLSIGMSKENGTASCGYKSQPLSARQNTKSPWLYSLEAFQGIPPRIFLAVP